MAYTLKESRLTYYVRSGSSSPYFDGDYYDDIRFRCKTYYEYDSVNLGYNIMCVYEAVWYQDIYTGRTASVTAEAKLDGSSVGSYTKTVTSTVLSSAQTLSMTTKYGFVALESDGTCSFSLNFVGSTTKFGGTLSKSFTVTYTLPTVPLYANITNFNLSVTSPTAMSVSWGADKSCSAVYYSINGGGSWSSSVGSGTSGSFNITGLTANTTYSVMIRVTASDSGLNTDSGAISKTTYIQNYITNASVNFNIGTDILLYISKAIASYYSKLTIAYSTNGSSYTTLRSATTISSGGTTTDSYNVSLTDDEKNTLYNAIPTTSTIYIRFSVETFDSSNNSYGSTTKVGTATIVDANPVFTNFTYQDINGTTTALTGNNQKIVKGYSNLRATVSIANKAVAQKGATMVTYRLVVGTQQIDVAYSGMADVNLDLNAIISNVFVVYAIDSRGNSTFKQISPATYIEYTTLARSSDSAVRTDNIDDETTLNFAGIMWSGNFGSQSNSLIVSYRYRATDSPTWVNGTTGISPTLGSGTFTYSGTIAGDLGASGFTVSDSFYIETTITDKLSSLVITTILNTGLPCMAIHKNGVAVKKAYDANNLAPFQVGGDIDIDGEYLVNGSPIGSGSFVGATHFWIYTEATIPTGYIKLEGQAVSRTTYADLFAIIGTAFGSGNGSTTFNVPDMRDRVPVGYDSSDSDFNSIGKAGGEKTVTLDVSMMPNHSHRFRGIKDVINTDSGGGGAKANNGQGNNYGYTSWGTDLIENTGGGGSHNNLQPYKAWIWIIKY